MDYGNLEVPELFVTINLDVPYLLFVMLFDVVHRKPLPGAIPYCVLREFWLFLVVFSCFWLFLVVLRCIF